MLYRVLRVLGVVPGYGGEHQYRRCTVKGGQDCPLTCHPRSWCVVLFELPSPTNETRHVGSGEQGRRVCG